MNDHNSVFKYQPVDSAFEKLPKTLQMIIFISILTALLSSSPVVCVYKSLEIVHNPCPYFT